MSWLHLCIPFRQGQAWGQLIPRLPLAPIPCPALLSSGQSSEGPGVNNVLCKLSPAVVPTCSKAQSRSKVLNINSCLVFRSHNFHSFLVFQNWVKWQLQCFFLTSWRLCCAAHVVQTTGLISSLLVNLWIWLERKMRCPGWQTYV